ncbi:MlaD family protein [Fulvivirga sediminis]|uniref:MCE family protein n=1 Tax=Fulvivirga sediminis TaxID=2803949 RepID=A0A937F520_9BACT|nr:MlaD family protein [Fulvivirga sediminis]MBL3656537.1 MCE family protein [Fulvivirga sediminis]
MKVSKELKVGVFMVFSIAILYLGFNYLKGQDFFSSNNKYYAIYENVDGLSVSNPVLVNGFAVGRVSRINLLQNHDDQILVEMDISGDIVLGDSATAKLNSDFLGNKSILLSTGNAKKLHEPGDTILAVLDKGIADILAESAQPVANNLEATIKKINAILDNLNGNSEKINRMMDGFEKTPVILNATIADVKQKLGSINTTFDQVGGELNTTLKQTQPLLSNLTVFSDSLKRLELNHTVDQANKALTNLNEAIEHFSNNEGTLGKLINEDSLYNNLNNTFETLDQLLIHLDTQPKDFFSPFGRKKSKIERNRNKEEED